MSSKKGTHTPVSNHSLDIEAGMLVSYRSSSSDMLGLVIYIHPAPFPVIPVKDLSVRSATR